MDAPLTHDAAGRALAQPVDELGGIAQRPEHEVGRASGRQRVRERHDVDTEAARLLDTWRAAVVGQGA